MGLYEDQAMKSKMLAAHVAREQQREYERLKAIHVKRMDEANNVDVLDLCSVCGKFHKNPMCGKLELPIK